MNIVDLPLVQICVGGTLSADSIGGDPSMEIFWNGSEKILNEIKFGGKKA